MSYLQELGENGMIAHSFFIQLVSIVSRQPALVRDGWLTKDGTPNGKPLDAAYFAAIMRLSKGRVCSLIEILSCEDVEWLINDSKCNENKRAHPGASEPHLDAALRARPARALSPSLPSFPSSSSEGESEGKQDDTAIIGNGGFDAFWLAYPNRRAKANAVKAWAKLNPDGALLAKMLESLASQKRSKQWQDDDGRFIPHAATWLNQRRWEDELKPMKGKATVVREVSCKCGWGGKKVDLYAPEGMEDAPPEAHTLCPQCEEQVITSEEIPHAK